MNLIEKGFLCVLFLFLAAATAETVVEDILKRAANKIECHTENLHCDRHKKCNDENTNNYSKSDIERCPSLFCE